MNGLAEDTANLFKSDEWFTRFREAGTPVSNLYKALCSWTFNKLNWPGFLRNMKTVESISLKG